MSYSVRVSIVMTAGGVVSAGDDVFFRRDVTIDEIAPNILIIFTKIQKISSYFF